MVSGPNFEFGNVISYYGSYATFGTKIPVFGANSGYALGKKSKNDGFTKMSVESLKSYIV